MNNQKTWSLKLFITSFVMILLTGCSSLPFLQPAPTSTPTITPVPATDTPLPTATFTVTSTATQVPTPTQFYPTSTLRPTETAQPTATADPDDAILIYYINLDQAGRFGCGEALWWLNTGIAKTDSIPNDIEYALYRLLAYRGEFIGSLYNPGYASSLSVSEVEVLPDGTAMVYLSGVYVPTEDYCDGLRFRDQIKETARQFKLINKVRVYINGVSIGDVIDRKPK